MSKKRNENWRLENGNWVTFEGRNPEIQFTDKFKNENPNWRNIEPMNVYKEDGSPYLGDLPNDYYDDFYLDENENWFRKV